MTKVMLLKKTEVSVTEEKKGKQIAVKENNILSLKNFYKDNLKKIANENAKLEQTATTTEVIEPIQPVTNENNLNPVTLPNIENVSVNNPDHKVTGEIIEQAPTNVIEPTEIKAMDIEIPVVENDLNKEPVTLENRENENSTDSTNVGDAPLINLVPESAPEITDSNEMDPELQEIKDRLDKVISDLNNYKKKIKLLENEVNQNLEKSREVLKDTQAAAKIMSIQQERQRQINEESGGSTIENDPTRILQKTA